MIPAPGSALSAAASEGEMWGETPQPGLENQAKKKKKTQYNKIVYSSSIIAILKLWIALNHLLLNMNIILRLVSRQKQFVISSNNTH